MAKNRDVAHSDSGISDDMFGSLKGVITICVIAGLGIYMSYNAGSSVSDRILRQVNKERKKHEKDKRRELKEKKREEKRNYKLELLNAKKKESRDAW